MDQEQRDLERKVEDNDGAAALRLLRIRKRLGENHKLLPVTFKEEAYYKVSPFAHDQSHGGMVSLKDRTGWIFGDTVISNFYNSLTGNHAPIAQLMVMLDDGLITPIRYDFCQIPKWFLE